VIAIGRRYLAVAITAALLYNVIMIAGDYVGIHYVVAGGIAFVVVVLWGYTLHSCFTFGRSMSWQALFRYALGMSMNYPSVIVLMFVLCDVAGLPVPIAVPLTTAILFAWNFTASRWAIAGKPTLREAG